LTLEIPYTFSFGVADHDRGAICHIANGRYIAVPKLSYDGAIAQINNLCAMRATNDNGLLIRRDGRRSDVVRARRKYMERLPTIHLPVKVSRFAPTKIDPSDEN
jgi:hypothetical protein